MSERLEKVRKAHEDGDMEATRDTLTFAVLFAAGSARSLIITKPWHTAGLEMLVLGGMTAVVSYYIGHVLSGLV